MESQNPKCQDLIKFQRSGVGGRSLVGVGVGGWVWNQSPEQGCSGEFGQKFLEACVLEA